MSSLADTLALAKARHRSGRLHDAQRLYRQILADNPTNVEVLNLLGEACLALGQLSVAAAALAQAIKFEPDYAQAHNNLGAVLGRQGKLREAGACFGRAVDLRPDYAEAHYNRAAAAVLQNQLTEAVAASRRTLELKPDFAPAYNTLGTALERQGQLAEASQCFRRALELRPDWAEVLNNLGVVLHKQGRLDEAVDSIRRALAAKSDFAEAHNNLGSVLQSQSRWDEAAASIQRALELKPDCAEAHNNLGTLAQRQFDFIRAAGCYARAIELKADYAEAHFNLGVVLAKQDRYAEAIASYRRSVELKPDYAESHNALAVALTAEHRLDEAAACSRRALELKPDYADAHFNYALTLLLAGRLVEGGREYEWRLQTSGGPAVSAERRWTGEPLTGRTILLRGEQGLGDTLQFIRYAERVAQRGGRVLVEVHRRLLPLLEQSRFTGLVASATPVDFDVQIHLMSLPGVFETTLETIPRRVPYLSADPRLVAQWRDVLATTDRFRIGIAWQGNPDHPRDRDRSIPLAQFAPLAAAGIELVSLQQGFGREQLNDVAGQFAVRDLGDRVDDEHGAFMDTAAIIENLDLVVTCDSAVAHLAGALGAKVWVALGFVPDFRWMLGRADSPWYPTMRLFRQCARGDWGSVFRNIRGQLSTLLDR